MGRKREIFTGLSRVPSSKQHRTEQNQRDQLPTHNSNSEEFQRTLIPKLRSCYWTAAYRVRYMILISPEMMTHFDEEADYDICDSKGWKKERKEGGRHGNFSRTSTGDIALQTSLSLHAQKRIKERNLKIVDALKGSKKAGVILSEDGSKVVTAVPEGWSKNAGAVQVAAKGESAFARQTRVPEMAKLPSGHCILVTIIPSNLVGRVLGQKHSNMRQLAKSRGASYEYQKADSKMIVWGPEEKAQLLLEDIKQNVNRFERVCGPPIPEDKLPAGQTKRVINIPEENIGKCFCNLLLCHQTP